MRYRYEVTRYIPTRVQPSKAGTWSSFNTVETYTQIVVATDVVYHEDGSLRFPADGTNRFGDDSLKHWKAVYAAGKWDRVKCLEAVQT